MGGVIILGVCLIAISILNYMTLRNMGEERRRLHHMIQAANSAEFVALERAAEPKPKNKGPVVLPPIGL